MRYGFRSDRLRSTRFWGVALMVIGAFVLILSLPVWIWVGMMGVILIFVGFVLWRMS